MDSYWALLLEFEPAKQYCNTLKARYDTPLALGSTSKLEQRLGS